MKLRVTIESGNDAFLGISELQEFADILSQLAKRLEDGKSFEFINLRDSNGNTVGAAEFSDKG